MSRNVDADDSARERNQGLMILEIISLSLLQMMLNWGLQCQKSGLWREGQGYGWADNLFANASGGSESQTIQSHRRLFEEIRDVIHVFLSHSAEARNRDSTTQERSVEDPLV